MGHIIRLRRPLAMNTYDHLRVQSRVPTRPDTTLLECIAIRGNRFEMATQAVFEAMSPGARRSDNGKNE